MSFASLLSEITKDKKIEKKLDHEKRKIQARIRRSNPHKKVVNASKTEQSYDRSNHSLDRHTGRNYQDDPAVKRLKAARIKERAKLQLKRGTKRRRTGYSMKKVSSIPRKQRTGSQKRRIHQRANPRKRILPILPVKVQQPIGPKLSFKELMKKADDIKNEKVSIHPAVPKSKQVPSGIKRKGASYYQYHKFAGNPSKELLSKLAKRRRLESTNRGRRSIEPGRNASKSKPNVDKYGIDATDSDEDELSDAYSVSDDDDDSFIVDDLPRDDARRTFPRTDYDRNEIWSIFNRHKDNRGRRQDRLDDDDNMEATGAEILEEEERTLHQARIDDKKEARMLERHRQEKLKRKRTGMH